MIFGTVFSAVPILIVSAAEFFIFKSTDPANIHVTFTPPSLSYVQTEGYLTPAFCITIYILTSLFAACFKEMFFRGFLLHKLEKLTVFKSANTFQALLYTTFIIPKLVRNFVMNYYSKEIISIAAFVIVFYLIHEFITGLKWGMLAKVSGAAYISIVDNFLYVFLANSLHIVSHQSKWLFMIHMLSTQLISLVLVAVYCKKASGNKEEINEAEKKETSVKKAEPIIKEKEIITEKIESDKLKSEEFDKHTEISPNQFKEIIKESSVKAEKSHNGELSEAEIDSYLKDFGKPKAHYNTPQKPSQPNSSEEESESFDVDDFLKGFSRT